jgi:hypothetical protein
MNRGGRERNDRIRLQSSTPGPGVPSFLRRPYEEWHRAQKEKRPGFNPEGLELVYNLVNLEGSPVGQNILDSFLEYDKAKKVWKLKKKGLVTFGPIAVGKTSGAEQIAARIVELTGAQTRDINIDDAMARAESPDGLNKPRNLWTPEDWNVPNDIVVEQANDAFHDNAFANIHLTGVGKTTERNRGNKALETLAKMADRYGFLGYYADPYVQEFAIANREWADQVTPEELAQVEAYMQDERGVVFRGLYPGAMFDRYDDPQIRGRIITHMAKRAGRREQVELLNREMEEEGKRMAAERGEEYVLRHFELPGHLQNINDPELVDRLQRRTYYLKNRMDEIGLRWGARGDGFTVANPLRRNQKEFPIVQYVPDEAVFSTFEQAA